jgi:hypothetical protein
MDFGWSPAGRRRHPGKLSSASGNASGIVAGETLKRKTGIDILHGIVPLNVEIGGATLLALSR